MSSQSNLAKAKLIETAADLVYRQGWNATGINQILGESKVPKGSFYYYFQSKDDLGVAIVKYHAQRLRESCMRSLLNDDLTGSIALRKYFEERLEELKQTEWRYGCPVGNFSNEVAANTEKIAQACRDTFNEIKSAMLIAIQRGQQDGTIANGEDPETLVALVGSVWQGSLLTMKTYRDIRPVHLALEYLFRTICRE